MVLLRERMMLDLDTVRFVVGSDGKPTAVQVDMNLWQHIVDALEDAEDVALARAALDELSAAGGDPRKAGWIDIEDLIPSWEADGAP
jgi:hypothetical protein